jgi:hypothetical protein
MTSRLIAIARRNAPTSAILLTIALCSLAQATLAQDPIRVESNQVLVPVYVFDKERAQLSQRGIAPTVTEDPDEIPGLTIADFHIFEDDKEQSIQKVSFEVLPDYNVHDS